MNDVQVRIGKGVLEDWLRRNTGLDDFEMVLEEDELKLILRPKVLFVKFPVSISLRFEKPQNSPEDPVEFSLNLDPMLKSMLKDHRGEAIRLEGDRVYVYPSKFLNLMKNLVVENVSFDSDYVVISMRPFHGE